MAVCKELIYNDHFPNKNHAALVQKVDAVLLHIILSKCNEKIGRELTQIPAADTEAGHTFNATSKKSTETEKNCQPVPLTCVFGYCAAAALATLVSVTLT